MSDSEGSFFDEDSDEFGFSENEDEEMMDIEDMDEDAVVDDEMTLVENKFVNAKSALATDPDNAILQLQEVAEADVGGSFCFKALKQLVLHAVSSDQAQARRYATRMVNEYLTSTGIETIGVQKLSATFVSLLAQTAFAHTAFSRFLAASIIIQLQQLKGSMARYPADQLGPLMYSALMTRATEELDAGESGQALTAATEASCIPGLNALQELDAAALLIRIHNRLHNTHLLRPLYAKCSALMRNTAVRPETEALVRECGGRLALVARNHGLAKIEYSRAREAFEQTGRGAKAIDMERMMALASMLSATSRPLFEGVMPRPELTPFAGLEAALLSADLDAGRRWAREIQAISSSYGEILDRILDRITTDAVCLFVRPYRCIAVKDVAAALSITETEVTSAITQLVLAGQLDDSLDDVTGMIEANDDPETERFSRRAVGVIERLVPKVRPTGRHKFYV
ncbi:PCI domain [Carpediemonas membranifera]|uniref:PCI domain n=1 Tax=Carpediemonas membranifera TaxID=201153 RepID=A0A8J6AQ46_9EUKA|nr:PCI domain [Carpediemonas membranifera]|eukprot:KAG9390508.1 PCI domain [Carpediemonas membranifera]